MLTNSKLALSLALLIATASGAMAASKHAVRDHSAMAHAPMAWQIPAATYLSFGSTTSSRRVVNPTYFNNPDYVPVKQYPGD
jgi:hypothetical protein